MSDNMQKKIRLKGHETFILREGWLAKGMRAVDANPKVFSEFSGADALGVGTNMAKAIRYWLRASGLTFETKNGTVLSSLGNRIMKHDPYFEDIFSLWITHAEIACNVEMATSWYVFFNRIGSEEFTREDLAKSMEHELVSYSMQREIPYRSVMADAFAIINMYSREKTQDYDPEEKRVSPFAALELLKKSGNRYRKHTPSADILPDMAVLFLLERYFEESGENSIRIDSLLYGEKQPGRIYNLNRLELNHHLDRLADAGYIVVNRTAGLDMVYRQGGITHDDVIEKYYVGERAVKTQG